MDEPLQVQVARALGFTDLEEVHSVWWGVEPYQHERIAVPAYGSAWCSMGILLDRYRFFLSPWQDGTWEAVDKDGDFKADGKTACEAVAKLIVTLKKEGKLPND